MSSKSKRIRGIVAAAVAVGSLAGAGAAHAAPMTFTVTKTADTNDGTCNSDCSLREAVVAANANPGPDTINLPAGDYKLSRTGTGENGSATGDLDIHGDTTLTGAGARQTTIDGQQIDRVIEIGTPSVIMGLPAGPTVIVSGVTVTGGKTAQGEFGGGISISQSNASLTLRESAVTGNNSGGGGGFGVGGGIYDAGSLTVERSVIDHNQATDQGGGVAVDRGTASFTNVTFANNAVNGPQPSGGGGGLFVASDQPVSLLNVTIAYNSVPGNSFAGGGIASQPGSEVGTPDVTATNTIVAQNSSRDCSQTIKTGGHNLDSDSTCGFTGSGDQHSSTPNLGPLANNGGPTNTVALETGSPALDKADNSKCPATDQRGVSRPQPVGGVCDVGAYEKEVPRPDLAITDKDHPDPVALGHTLTYTLTGSNQGPSSDGNVTITDSLPGSVTFLSVSTSQGECSHSGQTVTCQVGTLTGTGSKTGGAVSIKIRVRPRRLGHIRNIARITGGSSETNTHNNRADAITRVIERNDPRISIGVPRSCVTGPFTARVRISDQSALRGVRVTLDGRTVATTRKKSFDVRIDGRRLSSGNHALTVVAVDTFGNRAARTAPFRRCAREAGPHFTG